MKRIIKIGIIAAVLIVITNCSPKPKPIEYGADNCAFCDMTVMNNKFSAELVTDKGKVYKFDAIECMLRYHHRNPENEYALYLAADYFNPGELIDATNSTFIISEYLPSPMGAYLSCYSSQNAATAMVDSIGGTLYSWQEINNYINK